MGQLSTLTDQWHPTCLGHQSGFPSQTRVFSPWQCFLPWAVTFLFHLIQNGPSHDSDEEFELSLAKKDAEIARLNHALAAKEQEQTNAAQQD